MTRTTNIRAFKRVQYREIHDYLLMGWMVNPHGYVDYQALYGVILEWICDCEPPVLRKDLP